MTGAPQRPCPRPSSERRRSRPGPVVLALQEEFSHAVLVLRRLDRRATGRSAMRAGCRPRPGRRCRRRSWRSPPADGRTSASGTPGASGSCCRSSQPDGSTLVAVGDLPALAGSVQAARLEQARLQKWLQAVHSRFSFTGCSVIPQRSDQAHVQQLRTLLEASRELTELLAGLESLGRIGRPIRTASSAGRGRAPRGDPDLGAVPGG